jgi:hypothetical protein
MSHNCYSDIVPFVKHCFFEGDPDANEETSKLFNIDCYVEGECDLQVNLTQEEVDSLTSASITARGWVYGGDTYLGKRGNVAGYLWTKIEKQNCKIWIINTSQYGHVGEYDMAIIANEYSHIRQFVKDFKDLMTSDLPIEETDIVHWWC